MKKSIFILLVSLMASYLFAQSTELKNIKLSPLQKTEIKVGLVDVQLIYSRPSMRGRQIFGELVPYGKMWRTGANKNTKIRFSNDVIIGGTELAAGTYTIITKPNVNTWDIYIHTELDAFGLPDSIDPDNILVHVSVPTFELNKDVETLAITFDDMTSNSAKLGIAWERTYVSVLIEIPTDKIIHEAFAQDQSHLSKNFTIAAYIYFEKEKDSQKALHAINQSIPIRERGMSFEELIKTVSEKDKGLLTNYTIKSEILQDLNKKTEAIEYADRALQIAQKLNSEFWINYNTKNISDWKSLAKE